MPAAIKMCIRDRLGALGEADTRRVLKRLRCSNACIEETAVLVRETAGEGVCRSFSCLLYTSRCV